MTEPPIATAFAQDRLGNDLRVGMIVVHNNGIRPPGIFRIEWDTQKMGYVLGGVGKDAAGWLREWSPENVTIQPEIRMNDHEVEILKNHCPIRGADGPKNCSNRCYFLLFEGGGKWRCPIHGEVTDARIHYCSTGQLTDEYPIQSQNIEIPTPPDTASEIARLVWKMLGLDPQETFGLQNRDEFENSLRSN